MRFLLALLLSAACAQAQAESSEFREHPALTAAGDWLQFGVPLVGLGLTYLLTREHTGPSGKPEGNGFLDLGSVGDFDLHINGDPRHDLTLAVSRTLVITHGLKFLVDERRPNGGPHSFPSGHTSLAFAGAEFIRDQYGWAWGLPAYLGAAYVGVSRVQSHHHWAGDVWVGAAIGMVSNHELRDLKLPFGTLRITPQMFTLAASRLPIDDPLQSPWMPDGDRGYGVYPGLSLELRF